MARFEVTIAQPVGATPAIPPTVLRLTKDSYDRTLLNFLTAQTYTPAKTLTLKGQRSIGGKFSWALNPRGLSEVKLRDLQALMSWQQARYAADLDGHLVLVDEYLELPAQPAPHTKTLLTTLTTPYGYEYGFGVFKVFLRPAESAQAPIGGFADNTLAQSFQFTALEILNG